MKPLLRVIPAQAGIVTVSMRKHSDKIPVRAGMTVY